MLTGDEIKMRNLVRFSTDRNYRAASYDIRIGKVVKPDGTLSDFYLLPPQGIAEVVSEERVHIPNDVAGFAMVKTSLCNEGVLPLNIGILDPGYEGKVASFLVNFGRSERALKKGDVFLRLTFQSMEGKHVTPVTPMIVDDQIYLQEKQANMQTKFGREFLDIAQVTNKFAAETFERYRNKVLGYVAASAFILAMMTFLLNFANLLIVQKFLTPNDVSRAELLKNALELKISTSEQSNSLFTMRLQDLESKLQARDIELSTALRRLGELEKSEKLTGSSKE